MDDLEYTRWLVGRQRAWWKRALDVQAPYRWNLLRLQPGFTLEIGCGIGRNLAHLGMDGVGIERNPHSVTVARERGLQAFLPEEFSGSRFNAPECFDSLLVAHVLEHMIPSEAEQLLRQHLPLLKPAGRILAFTPQEKGFRSDATHVTFMDFAALRAVLREVGFVPVSEYSFPFPRPLGRFFTYNEFVSVSRRA